MNSTELTLIRSETQRGQIDDLKQLRSSLIQTLNKVDDLLGYDRTIPPKSERRRARRGLMDDG